MSHTEAVLDVCFSPDWKFLATASEDERAAIWLWRPEDLIGQAQTRLTRNLTPSEWRQHLGSDVPYELALRELPAGRDPVVPSRYRLGRGQRRGCRDVVIEADDGHRDKCAEYYPRNRTRCEPPLNLLSFSPPLGFLRPKLAVAERWPLIGSALGGWPQAGIGCPLGLANLPRPGADPSCMLGREGPMLRILHSADWQLGMTRHFLAGEAQARFSMR